MARYDCIDAVMSKIFKSYGKFVYRRKLALLLLPLFVVVVSIIGLSRLEFSNEAQLLFSPEDAQSGRDQKILKEHFLSESEGREFLPDRELEVIVRRGRVLITPLHEENLIDKEVMKEIFNLDNLLRTFPVTVNSTTETNSLTNLNQTSVTYKTLCMKWHDECIDNGWLHHIKAGITFQNTLFNLTYPFSTIGSQTLNLGQVFSRVETIPGTDVIKEAKVIRLLYTLTGSGLDNDHLAKKWEEMFETYVDEFQEKSEFIALTRSTSESLSKEAAEGGLHVMPRFAAAFLLMAVFSVLSCLMRDWVLSKPWLGLLGVVSACFAIVTAISVTCFIYQFNELVALMPFAVLGVGIDNMFIIVSAWRHTSILFTVEERMGRTFSEAAVSITITNITDVLAFVIGSTTKLPGVRVFCAYSGIALIFVYIYQITFFAACLAYMGDREANNLHCLTCKKVLPIREAPNKRYRLFCAGGIAGDSSDVIPTESFITKFFQSIYGPFIVKPVVKIIVTVCYLAYLGGAIYGCTHITTGLKLQSVARDNSPTWRFFNEEELYFTEYGPTVSVVIKGDIDYWEEKTQRKLLEEQNRFTKNEYVFDDDRLTVSWLRDFQLYLQTSHLSTVALNETEFYEKLGDFITDPRFSQYSLDLDLMRDVNETITGVLASRFIVTTKDISKSIRASEMMLKMRELAEDSEFSTLVFSPLFIVYEQYVTVFPTTMRTVGIAILCMFVVSLLLIPHPICSVFVTFCVVSIDVAVLGYMSLWGVSLNPISMINVILCIGFSVDFAAHITYGYVIAPEEDPNLRSVMALRKLGTPILQGALSTIIAISFLSTASVFIFRIFFKTLFLVMIFGAAHGLVFLPVFLTFVGKWMPHRTDEREKRVLAYSRQRSDPLERGTSSYKNIPVHGEISAEEDRYYITESIESTV